MRVGEGGGRRHDRQGNRLSQRRQAGLVRFAAGEAAAAANQKILTILRFDIIGCLIYTSDAPYDPLSA